MNFAISNNSFRLSLVVAALLAVTDVANTRVGSTCRADVVIAPSDASSDLPAQFGTAAGNVVNQSGLSIAYTPGVSDFDSYLAMGPTHDGGPIDNVWLIEGSVANFDMDFGAAVTVDAIAIWNKDDVFGVRDFNLLAADNPDFTGAVTVLSGSLALQPSNPTPTPFERFDFAATTARYYRIEILNNHGAFFTGLGEVAFEEAPGGGITVVPESLTVFRGFQIGGTLEDVFESDDSRIRFNPGFVLNSAEAPVWLIFEATLPNDNPGGLEIVMESQAGTPGLTSTLEAWNWNSAAYDVFDVSAASFNSDSIVTVDLSSGISNYVEAGTGAVRSRVGWRKTGLTINFPWEVRIDQFVWLVE